VRRATTVLVVEDDPAIRTLILETLTVDGYNAAGVGDTTAAMEDV